MAYTNRILESGERVLTPPARSTHLKPPKPLTPDESASVRGAKRKRAAFEKADPERYRDATQMSFTGHSVGQVYSEMGWKDSGVGPKHYDRQLPGLADPNAAPRPQKWSELTDEQRAHTTRGLAMHGTSIPQMSHDFGAQLDQAYMRGHEHGADEPYAKTFYSTGEPRKVVDASAKELGIPGTEHAVYNALTSPNSRFSVGEGDKKRYPNNEAATAAVRHADEWGQGAHRSASTIRLPSGKKPESYGTNMAKAVKVREQINQGTPMADTVTQTGNPVWNVNTQKTAAYANSWSDTHPQFFVSDIHSGGGGMMPHLSAEKPPRYDAEGAAIMAPSNPDRPAYDKSEREKAIARVPHFHAAAHEAATQAMTARGLGSVREAQAAQWGEEQIRRGGRHGQAESRAYPDSIQPARQYERNRSFQDGAQGQLF